MELICLLVGYFLNAKDERTLKIKNPFRGTLAES